ncbi:MAG: hypothetical protein SNJ69_06730 [Chloroflexaceae bacterium]
MATLTAEELLAGSGMHHPISIPAEILPGAEHGPGAVVIKPLTVKDLQLIVRASRDDPSLTAALMIQQALVEPQMAAAQVAAIPAGLARFLVDEINRVSGLSTSADELTEHVQAPLARACFTLAREFGWTPEEVSGLTIGQILVYLQMAR